MEHQVIEFFPSVCGVYQYPQDKIKDVKNEKIKKSLTELTKVFKEK